MASRRETLVFALAAVFLAAAVYLLVIGRKPAPQPNPPPSAKTKPAANPKIAEKPSLEAKAELPAPESPAKAGASSAARNPFTSPIASPEGGKATSVAISASAAEIDPGRARKIEKEIPPSSPKTQPTPASGSTRPQLVGIVTGATPMAVVRFGEQRFFLKQGEAIPSQPRYVVNSIRAGQVVLTRGNEKVVLTLQGGSE